VPADRCLVVQSRDFEGGQHGQWRGPWRADHPTVSAARVWLQRGGETRLPQGGRTTSLRPEWLRGHTDHERSVTICLTYYTGIDNSITVMRRPGTGVAGVAEA
jgi:hypothetical protein